MDTVIIKVNRDSRVTEGGRGGEKAKGGFYDPLFKACAINGIFLLRLFKNKIIFPILLAFHSVAQTGKERESEREKGGESQKLDGRLI